MVLLDNQINQMKKKLTCIFEIICLLYALDARIANKNTFIMNVDDLLISDWYCLRLPIFSRRYFRHNFPTYSRLTDIRLIT